MGNVPVWRGGGGGREGEVGQGRGEEGAEEKGKEIAITLCGPT